MLNSAWLKTLIRHMKWSLARLKKVKQKIIEVTFEGSISNEWLSFSSAAANSDSSNSPCWPLLSSFRPLLTEKSSSPRSCINIKFSWHNNWKYLAACYIQMTYRIMGRYSNNFHNNFRTWFHSSSEVWHQFSWKYFHWCVPIATSSNHLDNWRVFAIFISSLSLVIRYLYLSLCFL